MPKGVEHAGIVAIGSGSSSLFSPLMPKGVEHLRYDGGTAHFEFSVFPSDAERR